MSSPYLNILIVVGSILLYVDVILLGLDKAYVSDDVANALCMVNSNMLAMLTHTIWSQKFVSEDFLVQ